MSDKKTTSNAAFEQEFEKFLRDEATQVGSTYRKLPPAEPDAQLDARVRALAQRALLDERGNAPHRSRPVRRWVPAFASAAVLVLAAGIVWRVGPHNWAAQKDAADARATTSRMPQSSMPGPAGPTPTPAASQNRSAENEPPSTGPLDSAATSARDSRNLPEPFPSPKLKSPVPPASDATTPGSARSDDTNASRLRNDALNAATNARAAGASASPREKSAAAESRFAQRELKKSEAVAPPASAAATPSQQRALAPETAAEPTQSAASPALQGAPVQMRESSPTAASGGSLAAAVPQETEKPVPAQPVRSEESTPMPVPAQSLASKQDAGQDAAREQKERDEQGNRRLPAAPEVVERSLDAGKSQTLAKRAFGPPPSPPPPPASAPSPSGYPSKPLADAAAAPVQSATSPATQLPQAGAAQAFDHAPTADAPNFRVAFRPTAAQLAAWPAPNCHSTGTVKGERRSWSYPPEVPGTAQLRFVTVKNYLDAESREAALKAYSDFRHCYPDDHWPALLVQRLGTQ